MSEVKQKAGLVYQEYSFGNKAKKKDDAARESQHPELEDHDYKNEQVPVNPEIVWDLLFQLDLYRYMGPDRINPGILKELADVIAKPLSMIFEWSWKSTEIPAGWKLANSVVIFKRGKKDPGNYRPVTLTAVPGKIMEKFMLGLMNT
ncbi:RNA-directed DNA polymerase from mobile element jockey [Turdus rufiventris]|nr:RNA-directed DNA polymerase from mobile element jockey [Turdus rufiventris]